MQCIQSHFGAAFRGLELDYVIEDFPLGTGGAIRKALARGQRRIGPGGERRHIS